jgi:tRNA-specific 2-thiouridylase
VGGLTKAEVRAHAARLGLRTAAKPDSQDVCFITSTGGRGRFVAQRVPLHRADVVDTSGAAVGLVDAVELVTVGQRHGLGISGSSGPRYAIDVDVAARRVTVGDEHDLLRDEVALEHVVWAAGPVQGRVAAQCSAHGDAMQATVMGSTVRFDRPVRRIAPGQSVVLYEGDDVVGGGVAAR